ncbi:TIGR01459 family HAD-type hydrolase [Aliiroseovarius sp. F20344]|uniref:TIGR01459 family HAD-type hydrolase n=1 Tax=Aliiroseovarius sp. F20344 TaxID=2926414 RepID=UPI001FF34568|nr:TIGR01459 family HAD-type hydrolase [Aliiroseovarius sp. F20344]MCK0141789.1 TIGR01459 family HAD-type hydrolase [Aliiroseovarius sp. F20344]
MTRIITSLSEISANYGALFVDLWGCVHNGITAFDEAVAALQAYRANGGYVVLVTNSPKPRAGVVEQLPDFGVPSDCYDTIATSGDSARAAMFTGAIGNKVYFMGEWERDEGFFEPLHVIDNPVEITRVPVDQAEGIACCGPFDPMADLEELRPALLMAKQMGQKLLCANPDIIVDRGEEREWCAGAIAKMYTEMGGESLYFGKPHPPIYDLARRRMIADGRATQDNRILAIGDGIATDIKGALGEDIDSLFITGGLAREETNTRTQPDPDALDQYIQSQMITPTFAIGYLR